jgi:ribonuclease BN (tRNA processing enzyme)
MVKGVSFMKLTILGNNGPFPSAGGACSGYLVREGSLNILIDCGNGVLSNLQKYIKFEDLDAIILTHLHSDHMSDMMVLKYAIQIKRKRGQIDKSLIVYAPPEPTEEYQRIDIKDAFDLKPLTRDTVLNIGTIRMTFEQMKHPVLDYAVCMESGGKRFVFSGDTSWTENIISFAGNADLLMLDAGLLSKDKTSSDVPHLTAEECGIVAREAKVKKLLLTHFWPEYDINELLNEARGNFDNVDAAMLLHDYEI